MWKCPICGSEEKSEYICQKCGYDVRKDFVRARTVQTVPIRDVQEYSKLISQYDEKEREKAAEAARVLLEVIKKEQEKQAESERKAEAERKAKVEAEEKKRQEINQKKADEVKKSLYQEVLKNAEIDEKTLSASEQAHLSALCNSGSRQAAEGYISHLKNMRLMNEKQTTNKYTHTNSKNQEYVKKKTPRIFRLVAGVLLVGIGAVTALSIMEGSSENGNSGYSSDAIRIWDEIEQISIQALSDGIVDYETIPLESLCEELSMQNYYVSWPGELSKDMAEGTMERRKMNAQLNNGSSAQYNITCDDWYGAGATEWHERELYFNDSRYRSDFVEDETLHSMHNEISPLPYGIEFGDTFNEVYEKLGLTDEMLAYAEDSYLTTGVSVSIYEPEHVDGSVTDGSIYIYFGEYTFFYSFTSNGNELNSYIVTINK